jgi:hypothetical protein
MTAVAAGVENVLVNKRITVVISSVAILRLGQDLVLTLSV